jgi:hypothetical protein
MISMSSGFKLNRASRHIISYNKNSKVLRMSGRPDKVQACMYPQVSLLVPLRLLFLPHISLMLIIDEVDNRTPRVPIVDIVTKPRGVNDSEFDFELFLLELSFNDFDLCKLVELLVMPTIVVLVGRELGREKRVDQSSFTQSRLACGLKLSN